LIRVNSHTPSEKTTHPAEKRSFKEPVEKKRADERRLQKVEKYRCELRAN